MGAVARLGFIDAVAGVLTKGIMAAPEGRVRLFVAVLSIVWGTAIPSAFSGYVFICINTHVMKIHIINYHSLTNLPLRNVPYTITLTPIVVDLAKEANLPLTPLVWALVFGLCLGGNGTLTGAAANVVGAGLAEQHGYKISFLKFTKFAFPIMLVTVFVGTIWLVIFHVAVPWY